MFANKIEDQNTEFKTEISASVPKTIVAFANTSGGKIYIGVDDEGLVTGVDDIDAVMLKLSGIIHESISPDLAMFTECSVICEKNKNIVVLTVSSGTRKPYYIKGKGIRPEGVYIRQGAASLPASESHILEMIKKTAGDNFEEERSIEQNLSFDYCKHIFDDRGIKFGKSQQLSLGIIGEDGMYNNLGLLLSDQCPSVIKLARFSGIRRNVFKDRAELTGSILKQLEEAYKFLDDVNMLKAETKGLYRIEQNDYPKEAIREALLNAVVHREYSLSAPTLISVFEDRIEIVTVGGLIGGLSLKDISLGVSMLRNRRLGEIFYRLKLIEAYGTGIPKIYETYEGNSEKPEIIVSDNAFKIVLPNMNAANDDLNANDDMLRDENAEYNSCDINEREKKILSLFDEKKYIVRSDVESGTGCSQATAILELRELLKKGLLLKVGAGKDTKYKKA